MRRHLAQLPRLLLLVAVLTFALAALGYPGFGIAIGLACWALADLLES